MKDLSRVMLACLCLLGVTAIAVGDDPAAKKAEKNKTLDEQLLDDLGSDLFDGLDDIPIDGDVKAEKERGSDLDESLLEQLTDGEDIGEEKDPLKKIANRMRAVEELIAEQKTAKQTQELQKLIVADLKQMIEIVKKQCNCSGNSQAQAKPKPGNKPGGKPKQGSKPGNQASNKPASESQMRDGKAEDATVKREEMEKMLKEVWGHLPARVREQMQNSASEQFLSKYETMIEKYYERLSEEER